MHDPRSRQFKKNRAGISQARNKRAGISLVEILVSLGIFSVGIIGLYLSIQGMNKSLQVSMQRDVEAAYANMLISQVDPYNLAMQLDEGSGGYDKIDNNNKGILNLPDGRTVYYLREIRSTSLDTGDIQEINIYFYRKANDPAVSPYRHFKRELALPEHGFQARVTATDIVKDTYGNIWSGMPRTQGYTVGSTTDNIAGMDIGDTGALQNPSADVECGEYHLGNATSDRLEYLIPATENHGYTLELQFCEPTDGAVAGSRIMEVLVNGTVVDEIDIVAQAGSPNTFITKTYAAKPAQYLGVDFIWFELRRKSGSPDVSPVLQRFKVIR